MTDTVIISATQTELENEQSEEFLTAVDKNVDVFNELMQQYNSKADQSFSELQAIENYIGLFFDDPGAQAIFHAVTKDDDCDSVTNEVSQQPNEHEKADENDHEKADEDDHERADEEMTTVGNNDDIIEISSDDEDDGEDKQSTADVTTTLDSGKSMNRKRSSGSLLDDFSDESFSSELYGYDFLFLIVQFVMSTK